MDNEREVIGFGCGCDCERMRVRMRELKMVERRVLIPRGDPMTPAAPIKEKSPIIPLL